MTLSLIRSTKAVPVARTNPESGAFVDSSFEAFVSSTTSAESIFSEFLASALTGLIKKYDYKLNGKDELELKIIGFSIVGLLV
jgi:hypothetical protein